MQTLKRKNSQESISLFSKRSKLGKCQENGIQVDEISRGVMTLPNFLVLSIAICLQNTTDKEEVQKQDKLKRGTKLQENLFSFLGTKNQNNIYSTTKSTMKDKKNLKLEYFMEEKDEVTGRFKELGEDVETTFGKLKERFPKVESTQIMCKAIEANFWRKTDWHLILSELEEINRNILPENLTKFEFFPSQEHLIEEDKKIHYYIASNQFHKMITKVTNSGLSNQQVINPCDAIESITYIHNEMLETNYADQKEDKDKTKEKKKTIRQ